MRLLNSFRVGDREAGLGEIIGLSKKVVKVQVGEGDFGEVVSKKTAEVAGEAKETGGGVIEVVSTKTTEVGAGEYL